MQKMTNVLLPNAEITAESNASAGIKKSAHSESRLSEPQSSETKSSEKNDFYAALEQASNQVDKSSAKSNKTKEMHIDALGNEDKPSLSKEQLDAAEGDTTDVDHVLGQLTLASELDNTDSLGFSGKLLPLNADPASNSQSQESELAFNFNKFGNNTTQESELTTELVQGESQESELALKTGGTDETGLESTDTIGQEMMELLMAKTGLSKEELQALPAEKLTELAALAKAGATNFQQVLDGNVTGASSQASLTSSGNVQGTGNVQGAANVKGATAGSPASEGASLDRNASSVAMGANGLSQAGINEAGAEFKGNQAVKSDPLTALNGGAQSSAPKEGELKLSGVNLGDTKPVEAKSVEVKPIELKSNDAKLSNILGEKSILEVDKNLQVNNKSAGLAPDAAAQQLKGAELSVQLTPIKGAMELSPAQSEPVADIKTFQTTAPTPTSPTSRGEVPQFQLSLRQNNEQQNMMQEMIQRFSPVMKQQLMTMVSQGVHHAEIRLDPAELGQMMVRIQVQGDQTQVQFQVTQHQTRDLIEQAIPRLRDLLSEQGMQLTDSHVSQGDTGQGERGENGSDENQGRYGNEMDEIAAEESLLSINQTTSYSSGIDYYA
ncbi:flagellar hook-length control protein [Shewanella sediminis HAW-EB3]|uniref:Flagellar hook-length control protein n=1 Tax=Shewanella sediminis (strain HAW-EB3) TaxID=425104 RepID=A8FXU2_SHESH|nr:flagellar hook-length control protein FliK [Shewanella sediminis]ABV37665.1 flagellar hook-length control protein [Shewanella sediminis HAW-EB3]